MSDQTSNTNEQGESNPPSTPGGTVLASQTPYTGAYPYAYAGGGGADPTTVAAISGEIKQLKDAVKESEAKSASPETEMRGMMRHMSAQCSQGREWIARTPHTTFRHSHTK